MKTPGATYFLKHALETRPAMRRASDGGVLTGKNGFPCVGFDVKAAFTKPGSVFTRETGLVLDPQGFRQGICVCSLEDATEQNRHIFEFHAGPFFDRRDRPSVTEESIGLPKMNMNWGADGLTAVS